MLSQRELVNETITTALTAVIRNTTVGLYGMKSLAVEANFVYGADGTNLKAWIQTSLDGGSNWIDIINFAFTTSSGRRISVVDTDAAATDVTPTDGSLADNTIIDGILGDRLRVKLTTTGTYSTSTTLDINFVPKA